MIVLEDAQSWLRLLTKKQVALIKQIQKTHGSISDLAKTLKRDRSAVTRDVQALERAG